uniref:Uncharacterized protein n=1 Tax=Anopheles farauti TaxID=69004 RepID=A0A182Q049_9DIPT
MESTHFLHFIVARRGHLPTDIAATRRSSNYIRLPKAGNVPDSANDLQYHPTRHSINRRIRVSNRHAVANLLLGWVLVALLSIWIRLIIIVNHITRLRRRPPTATVPFAFLALVD